MFHCQETDRPGTVGSRTIGDKLIVLKAKKNRLVEGYINTE